MRLVARFAAAAAVLAGLASLPAPAEAQEQRLTLTFTPAVASIGGDAELGLAGSAGYRFSRDFSFEGDFTWIDAAAGGLRDRAFRMDVPVVSTGTLTEMFRRGGMFGGGIGNNQLPILSGRLPTLPNLPTMPVNSLRASADGQTMIGTLGVRYEPPVQTERFRPYLSAGVGLNFTDQEFRFESTMQRVDQALVDFEESSLHTGMAFAAGGGANVKLVSSLWANVDAKYFRLSRDRNLMRLGGGITLRF